MSILDIVVSIITVNYNGLVETCALIDTIPFNDNSLEVIVVDNGSKENEADLIARRYPHVKTIRSEENLGFAGGNNLGIRESKGKYLYLINNDTVFEAFNVQPLIERLNSSSAIGIACPKIRFAWEPNPIQYAGYTPLSAVTLRNQAIGYGEEDRGQYNQPHPTPYAHGAAMMIKCEAMKRVGLMPDCYFLYYEELDWSMMFSRAGYQIWYEPACTIFHKESCSTGADSPLKTYYVTRNRFLFAKRNVKSAHRYLSFAYLFAVVGIRDIITNALKRRPDLIKATLTGIYHFCIKHYGKK